MKLEPSTIGPKLAPLDLEKLQDRCGKLPADYTKFLKKTNGGAFLEFCYVAVPGGGTVAVKALAGLGKGTLRDILSWLSETEVPVGYFPVAFTPGGDPFVMSLVDEVQGVYFWDEPLFFKKSKKKAHAYFVAPTFSEFVDMLRPTLDEAEADLAACSSYSPPVGLVKAKTSDVSRPKFKGTLDAKLDQASLLFEGLFREGKCNDAMSAAKTGFALSLAVENWQDSLTKVIDDRVTNLHDQPKVKELAKANHNVLLLYTFLSGFVSGQFRVKKVSMDNYVYSRANVVEAVVRNQGLVPKAK